MSDQQQANNIYQEMVQRGLERFSGAVKDINDMTAQRIRHVVEPYFQSVILPILRARMRNEPTDQLGLWLNVADGLNNPMNIVDGDGNILFVCPPAFIDIHLNTSPPPGRRFTTTHHVVQRQNDMLANGDLRQVMLMEEDIYDAHKPREHLSDRANAILQIVEIYKFYQLPMEEIFGARTEEFLALIAQRDGTKGKQLALPAATREDDHDDTPDEDLIY